MCFCEIQLKKQTFVPWVGDCFGWITATGKLKACFRNIIIKQVMSLNAVNIKF